MAKDGHHLYPAMPYTSFSKISDEDMQALYAWFMRGVPAVHQANKESDIPWPLNMRWPLAIWNWTFHDTARFRPDQSQSAEWNRGAYLVQGLGHCGTCHTPRGIGFQEKALGQRDDNYLTGGTLEGWHAANLTGNMKEGLGRWSQQGIVQFLKTGWNNHSAAFGSMTDVIADSTQYMNQEDLTAIAVYLKSLPSSDPEATAPQDKPDTQAGLVSGALNQPGARLYMDNCAACHRTDGKGYANAFPPVAHNPAILSDDPSSLISIILRGSKAAVTRDAVTGLTMPDFGWRLNDDDVAALSSFVRSSWGNQASAVSAKQVKAIRDTLPKSKIQAGTPE
ncbi:MAG: Gluconate 2-dehydrogenase cytochrome c subunit [Candidatus Erwinia impunctatus]